MEYATSWERIRRQQQIARAVRARRHGRSADDLAAELHREYLAAGLPQPPEVVEQQAAAMADLPRAVLGLAVSGVQAFVRREPVAGLRFAKRELAGENWTQVELTRDASTRTTVSRYRGMQAKVQLADFGFAARLILLSEATARRTAPPEATADRTTAGKTGARRTEAAEATTGETGARRTEADEATASLSETAEAATGQGEGLVAVFLGSTYVGLLPPHAAAAVRDQVAAADADDRQLRVRATFDQDGMQIALP